MRYVDTESEDVDDLQLNAYRKKDVAIATDDTIFRKHDHIWKDCILICNDSMWYRAKYCTHCGKISGIYYSEVEMLPHGFNKTLTQNDIKIKYHDLPKYHIKDIWQKCVVL